MPHLFIYHLFLALFQCPLVILVGDGVDSPTSPRIVNKTELPRISIIYIMFQRTINHRSISKQTKMMYLYTITEFYRKSIAKIFFQIDGRLRSKVIVLRGHKILFFSRLYLNIFDINIITSKITNIKSCCSIAFCTLSTFRF